MSMKFLVFVAIVLTAANSIADTFQINDDSYTNAAASNQINGTRQSLDVQNGAGERKSLLRFDLTGIPGAGSVTQALMRLHVNQVVIAGNVSLSAVASPGDESTLKASNAPAVGSRGRAFTWQSKTLRRQQNGTQDASHVKSI
jgi:hypothetical protein